MHGTPVFYRQLVIHEFTPRHPSWKKTTLTIVSVKGIPTMLLSAFLRGFKQPTVPSEHVEIELGGRDDDVEDGRYD